MPLRLAGAGYAMITGLWLVATLGVSWSGSAWFGQTLFGLLALSGLAFAAYRDDVVIDGFGGKVVQVRGWPGLLSRSEHPLSEFEQIVVEEDAVESFEDGAVRAVRRVYASVLLVDPHREKKVVMWSSDSDESDAAREKLKSRAIDQAREISSMTGLPFN